MRAWQASDSRRVARLNCEFIATRETAELRAETLQMGYSLARLIRDLDEFPASIRHGLQDLGEVAFPCAWAAAATHWQLDERDAASAYLWAWLENQVMAAVKLVPLGQTAGQRMLASLAGDVPLLADEAMRRAISEDWENFTPGLSLASCLHETQYTRLFRS
jgi:urease accessory protein